MSLTLDGFLQAHKRWEKMDVRLRKLLGFNPATSNHYGTIRIYNQVINEKTTDEEILAIREKYVRWKTEVLALFHDRHYAVDDERFGELFSVDFMFGNVQFLDVPLDIDKGVEFYRAAIENYVRIKQRNTYALCPKCGLNYITNAGDESCTVCKNQPTIRDPRPKVDDNKRMVERYLLPYLEQISDEDVERFTQKEASFEFFRLRLPLLVECKEAGKECCRNEIKDKKGHNRYYSTPYTINGKKYHVCSQWWRTDENYSKETLKILEKMANQEDGKREEE